MITAHALLLLLLPILEMEAKLGRRGDDIKVMKDKGLNGGGEGPSAAIHDSNNILAVVRSTDLRHDGRSQGLPVAPNVKAQIAM